MEQAKQARADRRERRELAKMDALARKPLEVQAMAIYKEHGKLLRRVAKGKLGAGVHGTGARLVALAKAHPQWFVNWAANVLREQEL